MGYCVLFQDIANIVYLPHGTVYGILVPWPGFEPVPSAMKAET